MSRRFLPALLVVLATARPAEARSVSVSPPRCPVESFSFAAFLDSLQVELAGHGDRCCSAGGQGDPAALRVGLEPSPCVPAAERVHAVVSEAAGARTLERTIHFDDVARDARPRALSLAVAELVRALEQEPDKQSVRPPVAHLAPAPSAIAHSLALEGELRSYPAHTTTAWGGRLRWTGQGSRFHVDLDLGANGARTDVDLGGLRLTQAGVGLALGPRFATRFLVVDLGLRGELGWAWIRGVSDQAGVQTGSGSDLVASAGLRLSLAGPATARLRPSLAVEGGRMLRSLAADVNGQAKSGLTGYYLGAGLGLAWSL
jgi:hypothetical protein